MTLRNRTLVNSLVDRSLGTDGAPSAEDAATEPEPAAAESEATEATEAKSE